MDLTQFPIRELPADGIIREDGAYRMSLEHYHTQCADGPSVSSTFLRKVVLESPFDAYAFSHFCPEEDRFDEGDKPAYKFGTAVHAAILGDVVFDETYFVVPEDAPQKPTDAMLNAKNPSASSVERIEYWEAIQTAAKDKILLSFEEMKMIRLLSERTKAHPLSRHLFDGVPEVSLFWRDPVTDLWIKSRMDQIAFSRDMADLKTTHDGSVRACKRVISQRGYDMQFALGAEGMERVWGLSPENMIVFFLEKKAPHKVTPIVLTDEAVHHARTMNRHAMNTIADCISSGQWPTDADLSNDGLPEFDLFGYQREDFEKRVSDGLLPNLDGLGRYIAKDGSTIYDPVKNRDIEVPETPKFAEEAMFP